MPHMMNCPTHLKSFGTLKPKTNAKKKLPGTSTNVPASGRSLVRSSVYRLAYSQVVKSFAGHDEKELLETFSTMLVGQPANLVLCAHNGKEFDFPYICRRLLINGLPLPKQLDIAGKKPWEIGHLDTMELWKFGDYKSYSSLNLLTAIFNIPTPKDDIDGSMVGSVYWKDNELERICTYCQKDVVATAQLLRRYRGEALIADEHITILG
jgi:DNA polymerase elongation subunit (family B)